MPKIESGLLLLTLFSIILTLLVHSAFADRAGKPKPRSRLVPAPLLRWPENSSEYSIIVDKSAQKIAVYHRDNPYTPIKIYRCSTGENDGQKTRKNDRKTPEGIYFFTKSYIKKELSPRYGVRAFPIDYPNSIDKKEGRKGYGIWFHGLNKPLKPKDTNGCIALENNNIDQLSSYIKLNDTPIIISPKIEMVGPVKQKKERRELEKIIEGWRRAWERKEIDRYMSFYHDKFHSGRKNWQKWKAYKTRLAKKYKQIRVEIDNLQILRNNSVVLARFTQAYSTAGFNSSGEKRLYL